MTNNKEAPMKKNRIITYLFTVVLLIAIVFVWKVLADDKEDVLFTVQIESNEVSEDIKCWKNENDEYYVFLPSYADLSDSKIVLNSENRITIGDKVLKYGMSCDSFELNVPYNLSYSSCGKTYSHNITFLKSDKVNTMHINTDTGSMEYLHANKENTESANISCYTNDGQLNFQGRLKEIKGHGNSTWNYFDKKPYRIEFENDVNLLGIGSAKNWILLANAHDNSSIRNKLVFDFAKKFGLDYSPESQFVDLYLNGEYAGLYQLCEKNEVSNERVDISEDGFLVSLEIKERMVNQKDNFIETESGQALRIRYPLITNNEEIELMTQKWQSVENAILAEDGIDKNSNQHWSELIDLDSWARKYIIEEYFGSCDAGFISQFFYYDKNVDDGKIYAGPVWDYDHSIGNITSSELYDPQSFFANRLYVKDAYTSPWFYNLYKKKEFITKVIDLYRNEFVPLVQKYKEPLIDEYVSQISASMAADQIRWGKENIFNDEIKYIKAYSAERLEFLNKIWCDNENYHVLREDRSLGGFYSYHVIFDGECFDKLPVLDDNASYKFLGWYYVDTDEPFDPDKPIYEDVEVYAKWQEKTSEKVKDLIKLAPLGAIAVLFCGLCIVEFRKYRKKRVTANEK